MEKIGDTMKRMKGSGFQEHYERLKGEILQDPDVKAFLEKHREDITDGMIERSLGKLYEFVSQCKNCEHCTSLEECKNIIPGYEPKLVLDRNSINIHYVPCRWKLLEDERKKAASMIQSLHIPKEILEAQMSSVLIDTPSRIQAVDKAENFIAEYDGKNFMKGLYIYGPFGTGKTYLLGAIANALAEKGIPSMIIYVPEFIREMKQAIGNNTLNEKVDAIKTIPILMFDDIGAESVSSWVRDEVLGPILQYRMLEKLPTFFTSNFNLDDLEHHLTYSQRGEEEKVKAGRIMERIQYLSEPVKLDGPNRRY